MDQPILNASTKHSRYHRRNYYVSTFAEDSLISLHLTDPKILMDDVYIVDSSYMKLYELEVRQHGSLIFSYDYVSHPMKAKRKCLSSAKNDDTL